MYSVFVWVSVVFVRLPSLHKLLLSVVVEVVVALLLSSLQSQKAILFLENVEIVVAVSSLLLLFVFLVLLCVSWSITWFLMSLYVMLAELRKVILLCGMMSDTLVIGIIYFNKHSEFFE